MSHLGKKTRQVIVTIIVLVVATLAPILAYFEAPPEDRALNAAMAALAGIAASLLLILIGMASARRFREGPKSNST